MKSLLFILIGRLHAFNIDVQFPIFLLGSDEENSYFGYSSQLHKSKTGDYSRAYVGAPFSSENGGEDGAMFSCSFDLANSGGSCSRKYVPNLSGKSGDITARQMFGSAVAVNTDSVFTCAPRRQESYTSTRNRTYMGMQGECWEMNIQTEKFNQGSNLLGDIRELFGNGSRGQYMSLYGSAGFSIHSPRDTNEVVYGIPGAFDWTGSFLTTRRGEVKVVNPESWQRNDFKQYDYSGYSLESGNFNGGFKYVVGAPRGGTYRTGQVLIVSIESPGALNMHSTTVHQKLVGKQIGEYFGSAVLTGDFNGDGEDDLIVGSPLFTIQNVRVKRDGYPFVKKNYEEGRISVYLNKDNKLTFRIEVNPSVESAARFGSSLSNLGDITGDGCDDIAVGAPGEGVGSGAVFIFRGSKQTGINRKEMQKIYGKDVRQNIRSFGMSVSPCVDVDENDYKDLLVGAPQSATAVLLRVYPAMEYEATLEFQPSILTVTNMQGFNLVACYAVKPRKYSEHYTSDILTKINLTSDSNILFRAGESEMVFETRLSKRRCQTYEMKASTQFSANSPSRVILTLTQVVDNSVRFCKECGIIDPTSSQEFTEEIPFQKDCKEPKCRYDLSLFASVLENEDEGFIIGKYGRLTLEVMINHESGEPAYRPRLNIRFPKSLELIRDISSCSLKELEDSKLLACNLAGPILDYSKLSIELDGSLLFAGIPRLEFDINVASEGVDIDPSNNILNFIQPLESIVDLEMIGRLEDEKIEIFRSDGVIQETNFHQIFQVRNHEVSPITGVMVNVSLPSAILQNGYKYNILEDVAGDVDVEGYPGVHCTVSHQLDSFVVDDISLNLDCSVPGVPCTKLLCGPFKLNSQTSVAKIRIIGRIVSSTIVKLGIKEFSIKTSAEVLVPDLDEDILSKYDARKNKDNYRSVFSVVEPSIKTAGVELWKIIVSVIGGLTALLFVFIVLYILGCFRSRIDEMKQESITKAEFEQHATENQPMMQNS